MLTIRKVPFRLITPCFMLFCIITDKISVWKLYWSKQRIVLCPVLALKYNTDKIACQQISNNKHVDIVREGLNKRLFSSGCKTMLNTCDISIAKVAPLFDRGNGTNDKIT